MSYRKGAAIIIISSDFTQILLGERAKERGQWQIPQGGAEKGEVILQTLERELFEEVGIAVPEILRQTEKYIRYDWPKGLFKNAKHVGQEHIYFLLDGRAVEVKSLRPTQEFAKFKWVAVEEVIELTVSWKQEALSLAFRELKLID